MRRILFALSIALFPVTSLAQSVGIDQVQIPRTGTVLAGGDDVLLSASAANRTFTLGIAGRTEVTVYITYTRGGAGTTHITMTCLAGPVGAETYTVNALKGSATLGTMDSAPAIWSHAVAASADIRWVVTPLNDASLKCTVGNLGVDDAADKFDTVLVRLGVL